MAEQGREAQSQLGAASQQAGERSDAGACAQDSGAPLATSGGSLNKRANDGGRDDDLGHRMRIAESVQISVTVWINE